MITANNGILIVALLFAWGMWSGDKWLMAIALASAGLSWVVNAMDDFKTAGRNSVALAVVAITALGFGRAFLQLI